jgi:hypothetical protein
MGVGSTVTSQKAELSVALVGVPLQNTVNSSIRTSTLHAFLGEDLSPAGASLTRVLRLKRKATWVQPYGAHARRPSRGEH